MRTFVLRLVVALACVSPAAAADLSSGGKLPAMTEPGGFDARWEFRTEAYAWLLGFDGKAGIADLPPIHFQDDLHEILEQLDFTFMALAELRRGRFGIFADFFYAELTRDGSAVFDLFSGSLTTQITIATAMAEYRLVDRGPTSLDVMAGVRVWNVSGDLTVTVNDGDPPPGITISDGRSWLDPMVGVKGRLQSGSPWYLTGWAMIGGFGAGSDLDWDLFGGVGYELTDRFSLVAGYRGIGVDYDDDDLLFDMTIHGPLIGGSLKF